MRRMRLATRHQQLGARSNDGRRLAKKKGQPSHVYVGTDFGCLGLRLHVAGTRWVLLEIEMPEAKSGLAYESTSPRRYAHAPSLSVILLSEGSRDDLDRALASIEPRCVTLGAEVIVVRQEIADHLVELNATHPGVIFLDSPKGTTSAAMREAAIGRASGDILALRMDGAVGDGRWLNAFDATVNVSVSHSREASKPIAAVADDAIAVRERRSPASAPAVSPHAPRERRASQYDTLKGGSSAVAVRDDAKRGVRHQS